MSSDHPPRSLDLPALIGSRICHDLISPIGAIGNGLELLEMTGAADCPEVNLLSDSVMNANARIRFFRIAFGQASVGQCIGNAEARSILNDVYQGSRFNVSWNVPDTCRRDEARAAFLALLCLESSMPVGGSVAIGRNAGNWSLHGSAKKLAIDEDCWAMLDNGSDIQLTPNLVHFALLSADLVQLGRQLTRTTEDSEITLLF